MYRSLVNNTRNLIVFHASDVYVYIYICVCVCVCVCVYVYVYVYIYIYTHTLYFTVPGDYF